MTAAETHSGVTRSKGVPLMADKSLHHFQKEGITTPREDSVQVTRQQNAVGFLRRTLTSTTPVTCVPSLQAVAPTLFPAMSA